MSATRPDVGDSYQELLVEQNNILKGMQGVFSPDPLDPTIYDNEVAILAKNNLRLAAISIAGGGSIPGPTGPPGPSGSNGSPGSAATISIGSTTTGLPGTQAAVSNTGTSSAAIINFTIPTGQTGGVGPPGSTGNPGAPGAAATISIGTVTTNPPGTTVSVTNSGTNSAAILNFNIPRGDPGSIGATGPAGAMGNPGNQGPAATVTVGTTTTGAAGTNASVTNSGTTGAAILNFTIPAGATGPQGPPGTGATGAQGPAATIAVGTTTTGAPGTNASVTNSGTSGAAIFNFTVPAGATGATGSAGSAGAAGAAASVTVGTTTTGAAGTNAIVTNSGTSSAAVLNFTIPKGADGTGSGGTGGGLPQGYYQTSFAGTENPLVESGVWLEGLTDGIIWTNCRKTPGLCFGTMPGNGTGTARYADSIAILKGSWGPDQTATGTVRLVSPNTTVNIFTEVEVHLRMTVAASSITGYECNLSVSHAISGGGGQQYMQIVRWDGALGSFALLDSRDPGSLVLDGDILQGSAVGSTITVSLIRGTTTIYSFSVTDTTYPTGAPGVGFFLENTTGINANYGFSAFTATDGRGPTSGGGGTYSGIDSISVSGSNISLVNDSATPGNSKLYGTNSSGVLGWYAQPSGGSTYTGANSVNVTGTVISLTNDSATPGNNAVYGTTGAGVLGYRAISALPVNWSSLAGSQPSPIAHATSHKSGGSDLIALDTLGATTDITTLNSTSTAHGLLVKVSGTATDFVGGDNACHAHSTVALDTLGATTDITTRNASTTAHGLLPKLDNNAAHYLDGTGAWSTPAGGGAQIMRLCFQAGIEFSQPATLYAVFGVQNARPHLAFNDSATWGAYFFGYIPTGISLTGGITIRLKWKSITATTGNCKWNVALERLNTAESADSFATATTGTTACSGTTSIIVETAIGPITGANLDGLTAGDGFGLLVQRLGADGADTLVGDACLRLVIVEI